MEGYRVGVQMVKELEDSELFNAGLGCNLNLLGEVECEASVVDGQNKSFAALSTLNGMFNIWIHYIYRCAKSHTRS